MHLRTRRRRTSILDMQPGLSNPEGLPEKYYYFTTPDVEAAGDVTTWFELPAGVTCQRCVLQFRWVTGNSCFGAGVGAVRLLARSFARLLRRWAILLNTPIPRHSEQRAACMGSSSHGSGCIQV